MKTRFFSVGNKVFLGLLFAFCTGFQGGCVPAVVGVVGGAGAVAGSAATEERGMGGALTDAEIRTRVGKLWYAHNKEMYTNLSLSVREGRVLVMGRVPNDQQHLDAIRLAWQAKGVKEVIDQIKVSPQDEMLGDFAKDSWITTKLKSKLLFDKDVASRNFNIKTVSCVVYIMGIGQNQEEVMRVINYARHIAGVRKVVSYVRLKDENSK